MKHFRCGDVIPGCTGIFEAPDEDAILTAVAAHAEQGHGISDLPQPVLDEVRSRIVNV